MYPFTKDDLMKVKIKYSEILPYYQIISNEIGISGKIEYFKTIFKDTFVNRPSLKILKIFENLINEFQKLKSSYISIGISNLALETRNAKINRCNYNGEEIWKPHESIWSAKKSIESYLKNKFIKKHISGVVYKIKDKKVYYFDFKKITY